MEGMSLYRFSPHCVCIFSLYSLSTPTFLLSFSFLFILQLPLTQGSCLFTMYVRQAAGREQRWYGWNVQDGMVPKKEHCFT
jgi:hypothetical protein